jgi:hypothetical protein
MPNLLEITLEILRKFSESEEHFTTLYNPVSEFDAAKLNDGSADRFQCVQNIS